MNKSVNTNGAQSPSTTMAASPVSAAAAAAAANSPLNNNAQNGPSHEVLANFFQSLLSKKASTSGGSPTATSPASSLLNGDQANGKTEDHTNYRRPAISRKDVHKELDRMKQYTVKYSN
jgi:dynein light intermediate chain 1